MTHQDALDLLRRAGFKPMHTRQGAAYILRKVSNPGFGDAEGWGKVAIYNVGAVAFRGLIDCGLIEQQGLSSTHGLKYRSEYRLSRPGEASNRPWFGYEEIFAATLA